MKIVPLDSEKKQILQCFLELAQRIPGGSSLYKQLYQKIKQKGLVKATKNISNKINRIFIDIYKRICVKLLKKNPQTVYLSSDMQDKVCLVIRYYEELNSRDIFMRLCQRYYGNKQNGKVTQQQEVQFYEQVNMKVKEKFEKKEYVDFQKDNEEDDPKFIKGKFVLFAHGKTQNIDEQAGQYEMKIQKNWKNKLQNDIKKIQGQKKPVKINKKEESFKTKIQKNPIFQQQVLSQEQKQQESNEIENKIKLQLKNQQITNDQPIAQEVKEQIQKSNVKKQKNRKKKIKSDKNQSQQKTVPKRKIKKVKGPKQNNPIEIKDKDQIWTKQLIEDLCQQYLKNSDNLVKLVSFFLTNNADIPILSAQQISQQLIKVMLQSYDFYLNSHEENPNQKYQISELQIYGRQQIQDLLKLSNCPQLRKKLISLYLKMKKPQFKIKEKQAYEIFLHIKQEMTRLKIKQEKQIIDKDEFLDSLIGANHSQRQLSQRIVKEIIINRKRRTKEMMNKLLYNKPGKRPLSKGSQKQTSSFKNGKTPRKLKKIVEDQ